MVGHGRKGKTGGIGEDSINATSQGPEAGESADTTSRRAEPKIMSAAKYEKRGYISVSIGGRVYHALYDPGAT